MNFIKYEPKKLGNYSGYKQNGFILRASCLYFTGEMKEKMLKYAGADISYDTTAKLMLIKPIHAEFLTPKHNHIRSYRKRKDGKAEQVIIAATLSKTLPTGLYEYISDLEGGLLFKLSEPKVFKGN